MKRQREIRLAKPIPNAIGLHGGGPEHAFLGGLHDEHQCATPGVLVSRHLARRADQARDVHVMTASVHREHRVARNRIDLALA